MQQKPKVVCIIQTRMGSTRLPGKVLLPLAGRPVVLHDIDRVLRVPLIDEIVIATTTNAEDDVIEKIVRGYHPRVFVYRGSENDVLDRYYQAAKMRNADVVVRITSDCPLIDPDVTNATIQLFLNTRGLDYASNVLGLRTFPRGFDTEVVAMRTLAHIWNIAKDAEDREHVTIYIKKHPEEFKTKTYTNDRDLSFYRWTLDEQNDYKLLSAIYDRLYPTTPDFRMADVLRLFEENPQLITINQEVRQKNPQF